MGTIKICPYVLMSKKKKVLMSKKERSYVKYIICSYV